MSFTDFITKYCTQTAVYWGTPVRDGNNVISFADPVEIACRWIDKSEVMQTMDGVQIISNSIVHVLQDLDEEGFLFLGTLDNIDSGDLDDPENIDKAFRIRMFNKIPNIGATDFVRRAIL